MSTKNPTKQSTDDAIAMLMDDHKKVKALFKEFEGLKTGGSGQDKATLVAEICSELVAHATIEEEVFYPAVRAQVADDDLMDEALVEHAGAKELIAQLQATTPGQDLYDARVTVLGEQIDHHVKEEERDMFRKALKAKVDTEALGSEMAARKAELLSRGRPSRASRGNAKEHVSTAARR